jgi:hypothetical protein
MHVAIADFLHSHCLPFSLAEDAKLAKIIEIGRTLGPTCKPPFRQDIGGKYLDAIYETNWKEQMRTLPSEAQVFGLTVFGDGATIKTVPLVNVLAAGVNNLFALLNILPIVLTIFPMEGRRMQCTLQKLSCHSSS